jgi:hypothetical protein
MMEAARTLLSDYTTQKTAIFVLTAVRTSNPTHYCFIRCEKPFKIYVSLQWAKLAAS